MTGASDQYRKHSYSQIGSRVLAVVVAAILVFGLPARAMAQSGPASGTVTMHVGQAGYIGGVTKGEGVLHFRGRDYPFEVAGAGIGGVGVTQFDGRGPVYNLTSLSQFAGPFAELRTGLAIGLSGQGKMMLRNRNGVIMHLSGIRKGLALSTGVDAMVVSFAN